jgi:hypothetical protein
MNLALHPKSGVSVCYIDDASAAALPGEKQARIQLIILIIFAKAKPRDTKWPAPLAAALLLAAPRTLLFAATAGAATSTLHARRRTRSA